MQGLLEDTIIPEKQNEEEATYLLIRRPEDGLIDWTEPVENVHRLIRAVSKPYPGAFGMYDGKNKIPGQICKLSDGCFDVLGPDGIIHVTEYENTDNVKLLVGHKLK